MNSIISDVFLFLMISTPQFQTPSKRLQLETDADA